MRIRHELERIECRDRIEGLEGSDPAACGGRDRHFLVDRRQSKLERQLVRLSRFDRDGLPAGGEMFTLCQDLIGPDRHVLDLEPPLIVGECHKSGTDDQHDRPVHQVAVLDQRHGSSHDASFLPPSLRPQEADHAERHQSSPGRFVIHTHGFLRASLPHIRAWLPEPADLKASGCAREKPLRWSRSQRTDEMRRGLGWWCARRNQGALLREETPVRGSACEPFRRMRRPDANRTGYGRNRLAADPADETILVQIQDVLVMHGDGADHRDEHDRAEKADDE